MKNRGTQQQRVSTVDLTSVERTIIEDIQQDHSAEFPVLLEVLTHIEVAKRENTGGGFFTYLRPTFQVPDLVLPRALGLRLYRVSGVPEPCGAVLLMADGQPHLIDFHVFGPLDTLDIDFEKATIQTWAD